MLSIIILSKNEEKTILGTIRAAKNAFPDMKKEIIVVDRSEDETRRIAMRQDGIRTVVQKNNGKGNAMKLGLESSSGDVVTFTDADILNIDKAWIETVANPVINDRVDVTIGCYSSSFFMAATEMIYRPLVKFLFPEVAGIIKLQPLSGQRAFRRSILESLEIFPNMGVETAMNIDLVMKGFGIDEVILPEKKDTYKNNVSMVGDIVEALLDKAKAYGRHEKLQSSNLMEMVKVFKPPVTYSV